MFPIMKVKFLLAALLLLHTAARAETAYEALRSLGQSRGEDILNQVVEVNAQGGAPQPEMWTVVTTDPQARGGVRIFGIREGQVVSERAPTSTGSEPVPMDFNLLNLDSAGAFAVAEQEATRSRIGFERVNYVLQPGQRSATPVWVIDLLDRNSAPAASVEVSAENGRVVELRSRGAGRRDYASEERLVADEGGPVVQQREIYDAEPDDRREYGADRGDYADEGRDSGGGFLGRMQHFGHRVERHFRRDGAVVEKFFTGQSTIDPDSDR